MHETTYLGLAGILALLVYVIALKVGSYVVYSKFGPMYRDHGGGSTLPGVAC